MAKNTNPATWIQEKGQQVEDFLHKALSQWQQRSPVSGSFTTKLPNDTTADRRTEEDNTEWERRQQAQLQPWLKDPYYVDDRPNVTVKVLSNNICEIDTTMTVGLPPERAFSILSDPANRRVFKNIKCLTYRKVLSSSNNGVQRVEIDQAAIWRFLFLSGTFSVRLFVDEDRPNLHMSFKLARPGFMKSFEGNWQVEPLLMDAPVSPFPAQAPPPTRLPPETRNQGTLRHPQLAPTPGGTSLNEVSRGARGVWARARAWGSGVKDEPKDEMAGKRVASKVQLKQYLQLSFVPPPFLAHYVYGISRQSTWDVMMDFKREAYRIRNQLNDDDPVHLVFEDDPLGGAPDGTIHHSFKNSVNGVEQGLRRTRKKRYSRRRGKSQVNDATMESLWEDDWIAGYA